MYLKSDITIQIDREKANMYIIAGDKFQLRIEGKITVILSEISVLLQGKGFPPSIFLDIWLTVAKGRLRTANFLLVV